MTLTSIRVLASSIALTLIISVGTASAADLNWARRTYLPAPKAEVPAPVAVKARASSDETTANAQCRKGHVCAVCVANCDDTPPTVISEQKPVRTHTSPVTTHAENNADGVANNAPMFARPQWAGILCGQSSGCVASGIKAPPRPFEADIRITVINRYID